MARSVLRTVLVAASVLFSGILLGYRLACCTIDSTNSVLRQSGGGAAVDSGVNARSSARHSQYFVTRPHVGHDNVTDQTKCRRLWRKGQSEWFDGKFEEALLPVWMKENMELNEDVAKWWTSLQSTKDTDYASQLTKAFQVIPNPDRFLTRNLSTCRRCAVVGNSGNLKGSAYGTLIDSHDVVIRINQAKIKGFQTDVGKREDYRLMYPESFSDIPEGTNFVLLNFKVLDVKWAWSALTTGEVTRTYTSVRSKINVPPSKILFYNPALMWHIHHVWNDRKGRYPSSGALGVFFALQFCDELSVFGLGANSKGYWDHYWLNDDGSRNSAFLKTKVHDSTREFETITRLAEEKVITFYKGVR